MEIILVLLIIVILILLFLLFQKKDPLPINEAPFLNEIEKKKDNKKIIDELDDQFFALNQYNQIKYANPSAFKRFGNDIIDKDISSVVRNSDLLNSIDQSIKFNKTIHLNLEIHLPSYQFYKVYVIPGPTPIFTQLNSVVLFFKDFTEIVKAQKLKTDFVANVTHELRTPLMSIKGSIETIEGPAANDDDAKKKFMKLMSDQTLRMENLINDLLILSRIELEEHIRPNDTVNINEIFDQILSNFETIIKKKKIKINNKLIKDTFVIGDQKKLFTVFSNLIDNSIKYSDDNTNIFIESFLNDDKLMEKNMLISIKDEGFGIPKNLIPRITERFYRVDIEKSKKVGGTGLGLAIVKHIITQHRGSYEILNNKEKGIEFKIYLHTK